MASIIAPKPLGSYRLLASHSSGIIQTGESTKKARSCQGFRIQRLALWDLAFWGVALPFMRVTKAKNTTESFGGGKPALGESRPSGASQDLSELNQPYYTPV